MQESLWTWIISEGKKGIITFSPAHYRILRHIFLLFTRKPGNTTRSAVWRIWGSHNCDYEKFCLLESVEIQPSFRGNMSPQSSGYNYSMHSQHESRRQAERPGLYAVVIVIHRLFWRVKIEDTIKMDLRRQIYNCRDLKWMKLAQDRAQWRALVLSVLNLRVLLQGVS
jgi:hypothetical protein